ncbi:hypothetical protein BYT27DRAFT_7258652 [Phlegmacium glaucopus]|nr:hypothetical protein BYT27DRAFT_7258652 [Phlegmacium glaucopus]
MSRVTRSQTAVVASSQQAAVSQEEKANWVFFDKSHPGKCLRSIEGPRSLFDDASQECRFKFKAIKCSIEFWTAKETLAVETGAAQLDTKHQRHQ